MSNLREPVRNAIRSFVQSQENVHIATDVLRVIQEEANLMKETQDLHDMLDSDPFEQLKDLQRLKFLTRVTSCDRVRAGSDYSVINAVVTMEKCQNLQLTFKYERKPRAVGVPGCHVWYSIDVSQNFGQRENLLTVQVWAPAGVPSGEPAICVHGAFLAANEEDDEDGWEDIDEDEEYAGGTNVEPEHMIISDDSQPDSPLVSPKKHKKQKTSSAPSDEQREGKNDNNADEDEKEETSDSFLAFLDPDILEKFLELAELMPMDEGAAFFLLMTFPFYEHEWDLVGYVLDQVFGGESDNDEE